MEKAERCFWLDVVNLAAGIIYYCTFVSILLKLDGVTYQVLCAYVKVIFVLLTQNLVNSVLYVIGG